MCPYEVYQILLSVVENYAKNDRKFGPHSRFFDHPNLQSLDNYNFFLFCNNNVLSDAKRHASLLFNFLVDNSLHFGVDEIIAFKKLVANLDKMTIPNLGGQRPKNLNSYFKSSR